MQRVGAVTAALAALALGACGSSADDDDRAARAVPDGWRVSETEFFSFAHPRDWKVTTKPAESGVPGEMVTQVTAPGTGSEPLAMVVAGATPRFSGGFRALTEANDSNALVRFPQRREITKKQVEVPGAKDARLMELEIPAGEAQGAPSAPVRILDLVALSDDDTAVNLAAQARASDVERTRIREVVETLRLR